MLRGMRKVLPDVKVGVQSSCMLHWNKKAITFDKLQFDQYGIPTNIQQPPLVQKILNTTAQQQNGD